MILTKNRLIMGIVMVLIIVVSVSCGGPDQKKRALEALGVHRKRIQGLLGKAIVLKYTPQLRFVLDDSVERGNRVLRILDELDPPPSSA